MERKSLFFMVCLVLLSVSQANGQTASAGFIEFADSEVKNICLNNWDTNGDGELSIAEAADVNDDKIINAADIVKIVSLSK